MKLVHWPLTGGLLHLVQRGRDWVEPQPTQSPSHRTKCNSPPINGQCTNHRIAVHGPLLCGFNVTIKGLTTFVQRTLYSQWVTHYKVIIKSHFFTKSYQNTHRYISVHKLTDILLYTEYNTKLSMYTVLFCQGHLGNLYTYKRSHVGISIGL